MISRADFTGSLGHRAALLLIPVLCSVLACERSSPPAEEGKPAAVRTDTAVIPESSPEAMRAYAQSHLPPADVVLTGAAQTCFAGEPDPVGGVNISIFNVVNAAAIVAKLDTMDRFTGFADGDSTATSRFDAMETQLRSLIVGTRALAREISSANGSFSITMAPISGVLVVGYHNTEDDPYAYAYKIMSGQSSTSFILDMSRGQCGY